MCWVIPIFVLCILSCIAGCSESDPGPKAVATEYNDAFNKQDAETINGLLVPTLSFNPEMLGGDVYDIYRDQDRIIEIQNRGCDFSSNPDTQAGTNDATCYMTGSIVRFSDGSRQDCVVVLEMDLIGSDWMISNIVYIIPE